MFKSHWASIVLSPQSGASFHKTGLSHYRKPGSLSQSLIPPPEVREKILDQFGTGLEKNIDIFTDNLYLKTV